MHLTDSLARPHHVPMTTTTTEHTFPVFQSLRVSAKVQLDGEVHRIHTLGPLRNCTPEAAAVTIETLQEAASC